MQGSFFLRHCLSVLVFSFLLINVTGDLQAQEKKNPEPITQKLSAIENRIMKLEENQQLILKNQETIIEGLQQIKIRIRRT